MGARAEGSRRGYTFSPVCAGCSRCFDRLVALDARGRDITVFGLFDLPLLVRPA